jgi:large subunit ribosomal protein L9
MCKTGKEREIEMKVILLEDVKSLGKKGDVVEVNDGYARNYVLPRKLGMEANNKNMNDLKLQKANAEKVAREQLEAAQAFAKEMEEDEVVLSIKAGEGGRTFGSVSSKEIAQGYKQQCGKEIDKKKIILPDPIKSFGVFEVGVKLHPKVTGKLKVKVTEMKG